MQHRGWQFALLSILMASVASAETGTWTAIGPNGGRISAVAVDPDTPDIVYAIGEYRVFLRSARDADWAALPHWGVVGDKVPSGTFSGLAVDPNDRRIVYAGSCGEGVQMLVQSATTAANAATGGCDIAPAVDRTTVWPLASLGVLALLALVHRLRTPD